MKKQEMNVVMQLIVAQNQIDDSYSYARVLHDFSKKTQPKDQDYHTLFFFTEAVATKVGFDHMIREYTLETLTDIHTAYIKAVEFFMDDECLSKKFKMDESDKTGWEIYNTLERRREAIEDVIQLKKAEIMLKGALA